ncbi:MAG: phosphate/phosphite/phosphonate ABC transporter substrate-binding protein [Rhodospirillaceae bacterium]
MKLRTFRFRALAKRSIQSLERYILIVAMSGGCSAAFADEDTIYSFGIVPQQSASRLAEIWVPLLQAIEADTGVRLSFSTTKDIPTFESCLSRQTYAFAYMNPYHYTVFHDSAGYSGFAKQKNKLLQGLLVVRADSELSDLEDLENLTVAFPSPAAFGASVIPRAELRRTGVSFKARYVKSHDSVYRAVSSGLIPAGGGVKRTFNTITSEIRDKLKVMYVTSGYTPHAFAARQDVPPRIVAAVSAAMQNLDQSHAGLLAALGMEGIEVATNSDWDDVRALNLKADDTDIVLQDSSTCPSD